MNNIKILYPENMYGEILKYATHNFQVIDLRFYPAKIYGKFPFTIEQAQKLVDELKKEAFIESYYAINL